LRRDYAEHILTLRLPTSGGPQELLCVEYEALALWLATVHDGKAGERSRDRIRAFRAQVMAAASDILMGRLQPVPLEARRGSGRRGVASLLMQAEGRIVALERVVFVGEPSEGTTAGMAGRDAGDDVRVTPCPHCGGLLHVRVGVVEAVPDRAGD
jgi:hypothetical protein